MYFAWQDVMSKYRRTLLGPLWVSAGMITTSLALSIVFGGLFSQNIADVLPFVVAGILMFSLIGLPIGEAPEVFVSAAGTIKSFPYPFMSYVMRMVTRAYIIFAHNLAVYFVMTIILGKFVIPNFEIIPALLLLAVYMVFMTTLVGMLAARFRDVRFLMPYMGQILFFLTPIFWRPESLHGARGLVLVYNPFYYILNLVRQPLMGLAPTPNDWLVSLTVVVAVGALWFVFFSANRRRIVFWL
jgi:ABC-2 type transport system permease protein/lipopolysaccharide transport system permease protein